jgi:enoyl-[acyl-carrier protein] reductase II
VEAGEDATRLALKSLTPVRLLQNAFFQQVKEMEMRGASAEELAELLGRGRAKKGMFEGDLVEGELEIGQISGLISSILPAAEIVKDIIQEYAALRNLINQKGNFGN